MENFLIELEKEVLKNVSNFKTGSISITDKIENLKNAEKEIKRINTEIVSKVNLYISENNLSETDVKIIEEKLSKSIEKLNKIMF
jgi:hypothetical protein